ncbi:MAG: Pycsar system effector family protein [Pseudomonadota bacterium]
MSSSAAIYMLRTMQQHHVALSTLADQKANIIVAGSIGIIIFSMGRFEAGDHPAWLMVLCATALLSCLFAIVAVNPSFKKKTAAQEQLVNPLFFGHFAVMTGADFEAEIMGLIENDETIYKAMVQDIYQLGKSLYLKKYRYLNFSYSIFICGILLSMVIGVSKFLFA